MDYSFKNNLGISSIINEFIFCLFIIYDLNEEEIKNIFQTYILGYLFVYYSMQYNKKNLNDFLCERENTDLIKNIFNLYCLKYQICFLLYNENQIININFEESILFLKKKEINYKLNDSSNIILKEKKLGGILDYDIFKIIELPNNLNEFNSKYININCINCKETKSNYYICLICESKICDDINCSSKNNEIKDFSLNVHSKKCGGGNNIFISNINSEIVYLLKKNLIKSGIYIYLNSSGKHITNSNNKNLYILNKTELQKGVQNFIDIIFRKKV